MRSRFRDLPLRQKVISIILAASLAALGITVVAAVVYELRSFRPEAEAEMQADAEVVGRNIVAAVRFFDSEAAVSALETLEFRPDFLAAAVYTLDGEVFAEHVRDGVEVGVPSSVVDGGPKYSTEMVEWVQEINDGETGEIVCQLYQLRNLPPLLTRLPQYGLMLAAVCLALSAAGLIMTLALERQVSAPILELALASQQVTARQDARVRVERQGNDEIGRLTDAFNEMLTHLEQRESALRRAHAEQRLLQEELMQAQKMESIGRLAGGVAHDFNNLLTVIVGSTDLALRRTSDETKLRSHLGQIRAATEQASHLTRQLLAFARKQLIEPQVLNPVRLLRDLEKMLSRLIGATVELRVAAQADVWPVRADPTQLTQVLVNLAVNARDAMRDGGVLTIEAHNAVVAEGSGQREIESGDYVVLSVHDTGVGMSEEVKRHLFEPFFTTKEPGRGTGLGLATCYGIVRQVKGHIAVFSEEDRGTTFKVYLPRSTERPAEETPPEGVRLPTGTETILVVEDNAMVRTTAVELLRAQGYAVLEADGGGDAIELVRSSPKEIDLLLTDVVMPQMSGQDVARRLLSRRPGLRILYVSGYTADILSDDGRLPPGIAFLQKPFTSEALVRKVRAILDAPVPAAASLPATA